jgi:predicted N-formylglutamate amidohydrolase
MTATLPPALIENEKGTGSILLLCDHATNHVPADYAALGLDDAALADHIAWDPGALGVSRALSVALDAPLAAAVVSRLVIDMNRPEGARGSILEVSDGRRIPGNAGLDAAEKRKRFERWQVPYHDAVSGLLDRLGGSIGAVVAVHSFTPVYGGRPRPWDIGVLHDGDTTLARPLIDALSSEPGLVVGENEPYSPADDVYYSLERHAVARGLKHVMLEIRNDRIATVEQQRDWAVRLARVLGR